MVELVLHLGAHRTATTAAQKLMRGRARLLLAAGVRFSGPDDLRGWGMYNILQRMVDGRARPDQVESAARALSEIAATAPPGGRILFSDENLLGTMALNHATAALYPDAAARLAALSRILPAAPALICVTIRDAAGYWQSSFAHLRARGRSEAFEADRLARSPHSSWLPVLRAIRAGFPRARLCILGYDDSVVPRLVATLVGSDLAARLPEARRTFSLGLTDADEAQLAALPAGPDREALALRLRAGRDTPDRSFDPDQARLLAATYAKDWEALTAGAIDGAILNPGQTGQAA